MFHARLGAKTRREASLTGVKASCLVPHARFPLGWKAPFAVVKRYPSGASMAGGRAGRRLYLRLTANERALAVGCRRASCDPATCWSATMVGEWRLLSCTTPARMNASTTLPFAPSTRILSATTPGPTPSGHITRVTVHNYCKEKGRAN